MADQKVKIIITADAADAIAKVSLAEESFKTLGIKSAGAFNQMRNDAKAAFESIKNTSTSTSNDILRAQHAAAAQMKSINEQQYGHHATLIESMKKNWIAASVAIGAAMVVMNKAWDLAKIGAAYAEQEGILNNLAKKYNTTADEMVKSMARASDGLIANADLMEVALGGIAKGMKPEQMIKLAEAANLLGDTINMGPTEALKTLATSLESGKMKGLKSFAGATIDLGVAFGDLEKKLTDAEKAQAMYFLMMQHYEKLQKQQTKNVDEAADKIDRMEASYNNAKLAAAGFFKTIIAGAYDAVVAIGNVPSYDISGMGGGAETPQVKKKGTSVIPKVDPIKQAQDEIDAIRKTAQARFDAEIKLKKGTSDSERAAKDAQRAIETALKQMTEATRKAAYEIDSVGLSQYQKDLDRIHAEAAEYLKITKNKGAVAKFVAAETELALRKSFIVQTEDNKKMYDEMQKGAEEYRKIVADEQSFSVSKHEQAMLKIIANENNKLLSSEKLMDEGKISWDQYQAYLVLVQKNTSLATTELLEKELSDKYNMQLKYLKDMGQEYSDQYRNISIMQIQNDANKLERDFQNASGGGLTQEQQNQVTAEQELTKNLLTEWEARLREYAAFQKGMGNESAANTALAAAQEMANKKIALEKSVSENAIKSQENIFNKAQYIANEIHKLDQSMFDSKIKLVEGVVGGFDTMLNSAMSCYDKDSDAYHRLAEWKKGVLIAQQAVEIAKNAQIIASNLGLITSNTAVSMSNAGAAVTGASIGVGPTGFATAAAMIALLDGVFATYGIATGGGGSSASATSTPTYTGQTTVLGAADGTGSESIANSWKLLQDIEIDSYNELRGIYSQVKDLNNNITGLVTSIVRTGGISSAGMNLNLDYQKGFARETIWEGFFYNTLGEGIKELPLMKWITNVLGSWGESIFGGGVSSAITGQGIEIGQTVVQSIINGADISAKQYTQVTETHNGGWFGSDWTSGYTVYGALDKNVTTMFTLVFKNIGSTLVELSKQLGTDTNAALNYVFNATKINLQGMTTDEMNKALQEYISNISDTAVEALFGTMLKSYQKLNEGLMETAVRLVTDKAIIEQMLTKTGQSFSGTTSEAIALSEALISLSGDLDTLKESASTYYDKFTTDAQKQTDLQKSLSDAMNYYNLSLADSREGYKATVKGLDLTTQSGQAAFVALLSMSDSADKYYSYIEDLAKQQRSLEIQLMEAQGDAAGALAAKRADELAAMDATLRPLQQMIWLTQDWATKLKDATTATTSAVDAQISLSKSAASTARSNADAYRQIIDSLTAEQTKIRGGGIAGAQNRLDTVFSTAMTGDQAALKALPSAIDDMLAESLRTSKTAEDYARAQGKALIQLEQAKTASTAMVNWEEYQATLLEAQTGLLEEIKAELEKTDPSLEILTQQATMLGTIADILQTQTTQVIAGNTYTIDQTGSIVAGNALTSAQTDQVITGNATQDAIKNITNLNTAYSQEMLNALISGETTQTSSLEGILTANNLTVSLIRQLVTLTTNSQMEKAAAAIHSAAAALVPLTDSLTAALASQASTAAALTAAQTAANAPDNTLAQILSQNATNTYSNAVAAAVPGTFALNTNKLTKDQMLTNLYNAGTGAVITQKDISRLATNENDRWDSYNSYYLDVKGMLQSQSAGMIHYDLGEGWQEGSVASSAPLTASLIAGKAAQEAAEAAAVSAAYSAATTASQQAAEANAKLASAQASLNALVAQYKTTYGTTPSFAYGGISTGSESGYEATLHGTELIISPKSSFPATLTGGDNVILIDEIRKLRAEAKEQNARLARMEKTNKTTADVLQRVTRDGESMLTTEVV